MGVEEVVKEGRCVLQGVGDIEGCGGLVRDLERLLVCRDLTKGRREPGWVTGEEGSRSVGEVLALSRDRELYERRDDRREDRERDRDHRDDGATTTAVA